MWFSIDCDIQRGAVRALRTLKVAADDVDGAIAKARAEASMGEGTLVKCMNVTPTDAPEAQPAPEPKRETLSLKKSARG